MSTLWTQVTFLMCDLQMFLFVSARSSLLREEEFNDDNQIDSSLDHALGGITVKKIFAQNKIIGFFTLWPLKEISDLLFICVSVLMAHAELASACIEPDSHCVGLSSFPRITCYADFPFSSNHHGSCWRSADHECVGTFSDSLFCSVALQTTPPCWLCDAEIIVKF